MGAVAASTADPISRRCSSMRSMTVKLDTIRTGYTAAIASNRRMQKMPIVASISARNESTLDRTPRTLAGSRVGAGPLSTHGQAASMANATIAA